MSFEAFLPAVAISLFWGGIAALFLLLLQILRIARLSRREKKYHLLGWQSELRRGLVAFAALLVIGTADLSLWVGRELRMYTPAASGVPLGTVSVVCDRPDQCHIVYATRDEKGHETYEAFPVHDGRFRLIGERIRWSPGLASLGLTDHVKVTRIDFFPQKSTLAPDSGHTVFSVDVARGTTSLFARLREFERWLPFVKADTLMSPPCEAGRECIARVSVDSAGLILH